MSNLEAEIESTKIVGGIVPTTGLEPARSESTTPSR